MVLVRNVYEVVVEGSVDVVEGSVCVCVCAGGGEARVSKNI